MLTETLLGRESKEKPQEKQSFFGCRGSSGVLLAAFWAFLLALWRCLGDLLSVLRGVLEVLEAPRRDKTAQDGRKACMQRRIQSGRASGAIMMNPDV